MVHVFVSENVHGAANDLRQDMLPLYAGIQERVLYNGPVCVGVQALIIAVWAVWHSGRMCSSLRNSLVLLVGEGGPAMTANKGTAQTHTHTPTQTHTHFRIKICTMSTNLPVCV